MPDIIDHCLPFDYEESVPFIVGPDNSGKKFCIRDKLLARSFDRHLAGIKVYVIESKQSEDLVNSNDLILTQTYFSFSNNNSYLISLSF